MRKRDIASEKRLLRKHVNAVAIVPNVGKISLLARRIYNVLLYKAQIQGNQPTYQMTLAELISLTEFSSHNYVSIKKTLKQLLTTIVEWQSPSSSEVEVWEACALISSIKLTRIRQNITIEWSFAPQIHEKLIDPDRYLQISIESVAKLRTHASVALYEICARYTSNPGRLTPKQDWHWWHPVLTGKKEDGQNASYRYFKRDVLMPSIEEINNTSDIEIKRLIEYKSEQDGKSIKAIQFEVQKKEIIRANKPPAGLLALSPELSALGISEGDASKIAHEFGVQGLKEGIGALKARDLYKGTISPVVNPYKYLRAVIPAQRQQHPPVNSLGFKAGKNIDMSQASIEKMRAHHHALEQEILQLSEQSRAEYLEAFDRHIKTKKVQVSERLHTSGWQHPLVKFDFLKFYEGSKVGG